MIHHDAWCTNMHHLTTSRPPLDCHRREIYNFSIGFLGRKGCASPLGPRLNNISNNPPLARLRQRPRSGSENKMQPPEQVERCGKISSRKLWPKYCSYHCRYQAIGMKQAREKNDANKSEIRTSQQSEFKVLLSLLSTATAWYGAVKIRYPRYSNIGWLIHWYSGEKICSSQPGTGHHDFFFHFFILIIIFLAWKLSHR